METGTVKWYNDAKQYGFIVSDLDKELVMVYKDQINADPKALFEYQKVSFVRNQTEKGNIASDVSITKSCDLSIYDYEFVCLDSRKVHLSRFADQVLLVVNTASECGLTPQYAALEELYQKFKHRKFSIVAFPSNNFLSQEPRTNEEIAEFCETKYGITFMVMEKSNVVKLDRTLPGESIETAPRTVNPLYVHLEKDTGVVPEWNFHKYLIAPVASSVTSYDHMADPLTLVDTIEDMLGSIE